ncbi:carboxy terminal-processing peptidase [Thiopseudomonas denitrificans]|uniref:S41A family C-terminal processing peptidase-1 n=1 Tax=Thiopseudomonas denitrificans TaxID=1501432 RepID=A0A4R6TX35_9GAMM|nr:carboxy terminal-processing peptidase [Thiopseudomonas denitrificans]TDQ36853.1 S41A family C-terminal processing peptidase-1 [Thiopseudomonas denitrificans]
MKLPSPSILTAGLFALLLSLGAQAVSKPDDWAHLQPEREQVIASLNVVELLKRHHYDKPPLDNARSQKTHANYLKSLDPARLLFTRQDIEHYSSWEYRHDDFLHKGELEPGFELYRLYLQRQSQYLEQSLETLKNGVASLDFDRDETLETDREKAPWPADMDELQELWRKRLKDEVLRLKLAGKDEAAIAELLTKRYRNQRKRMQQIRSEDVFQTYINAFAQTYDPHTSYLSPENAENFDINMSLSLEGIGAVLQNDNEHVKVVRLVPAGPADKSKQLAPADRIIAVGQGDKALVDVIGWRLDEVVKLIRGPKGTQVRLEIIPASNAPNDQSSKVVSIIREAVKLEEQAAKKSILELEQDGHKAKIGVIEIPTFYIDFKAYRAGTPDYKSTTRDVKRLISELQKEQVEGIVIDLRNNGGGSLQEATELTSLFIERGPTVLVRNSNGRVDVLADEEASGPFYRGPVAVLVNRLSASASEIFAGAMQDYHRALIVGGQTFGKGTVQSIQPLNHGELKLTLAKFYRVSGQSTQHQGVIPDIHYPALVDVEQIGESALPEAMPWDSIKPAIAPRNDPFKPYMDILQARHDDRTGQDPDFVYTRKRLELARQLMQETVVSLKESTRRAEQERIEKLQLDLENQRREVKGEELLKALKDEDEEDSINPHDSDNKDPMDDAYLKETAYILLDWTNLNQVARHP